MSSSCAIVAEERANMKMLRNIVKCFIGQNAFVV